MFVLKFQRKLDNHNTDLFILHTNGRSRTVPLWHASIMACSLAPPGSGLTMVVLISSSNIVPSL